MNKFLLFTIVLLSYLPASLLAEVNWQDDLEAAKKNSKLFKKPILLWVGVHSFRTRPMIVTEKKFIELSKKITCVNLDPRNMTDEQRAEYGVDNSHFSRFYYYDIDFGLIGSEDVPPKSIYGMVDSMLKSVTAKEEEEKAKKEAEKNKSPKDKAADELWAKIESLETNQQYAKLPDMLESFLKKYPTAAQAGNAKAKLEKLNSDPELKKLIEKQKNEEEAAKLYRLAKNMSENKMKDQAIEKLEKIVSEYKDTVVAKDAADLLKTLKE